MTQLPADEPRSGRAAAGYLEEWRADDEANRALYEALLRRHGLSSRALNWSSDEGQRLRFRVLTDIGLSPTATVLDVGCGTGDLLEYLRAGGFRGRYIGIDITPAMIEASRRRFADATFAVANLLEIGGKEATAFRSDYVLASGIFYFRRAAPVHFMRDMIAALWAVANVGAAFNSLSKWADQPAEAGEFRADPIETIAFCRKLTRWVALRHDYHPGDFTVYLRREGASADMPSPRGIPDDALR